MHSDAIRTFLEAKQELCNLCTQTGCIAIEDIEPLVRQFEGIVTRLAAANIALSAYDSPEFRRATAGLNALPRSPQVHPYENGQNIAK